MCCAHIAQLMTHLAIYAIPLTLQLCYKPLGILQRVTKSEKVIYQVMMNFKNFVSERVEKQEFPRSPVTFF